MTSVFQKQPALLVLPSLNFPDETTITGDDFSPLARLRLNFGGENCLQDCVKLTTNEFEGKIFETDQEQMQSFVPIVSKDEKVEKKRQKLINQVYNSRKSTVVDKFLEQALQRCNNKGYNSHQPQRIEIKPLIMPLQPTQQPIVKKQLKRKPQSIQGNYYSAQVVPHTTTNNQVVRNKAASLLIPSSEKVSGLFNHNISTQVNSNKEFLAKQIIPKPLRTTKQQASAVTMKCLNNAATSKQQRNHIFRRSSTPNSQCNHRKSQSQASMKSIQKSAESNNIHTLNVGESRNHQKQSSRKNKRSQLLNFRASYSFPRGTQSQLLLTEKEQTELDHINIKTLRNKLMIFKQKMNNYVKEICPSSLLELLYMKTPVSKQSFRAAKCVCLLLSSFYEYPSFKDYTFSSWLEIHHFLSFTHKNSNIMDEIELIKIKAEHKKAVRNQLMYDQLKKELKFHQVELEQHMNETLKSPKVQNYQYKPIFSFIFYLVSFLTLKKLSDNYNLRFCQSRRSSSSTSSRQKLPLLMTRSLIVDTTRRSTERLSHRVQQEPQKNIANQILQTIERVFNSNKQYHHIKKKQNKENKNPRIINDQMYKKTSDQSNATFGNKNVQTNNKDIESCIDHNIVDISTQIQNFQILSPSTAHITAQNTTGQDLKKNLINVASNCKMVPVSAFDSKADESPDQIMMPPQPQQLERQILMNTADWRLAECLKNSIDTYQDNQSVNVEQLICKVKLEDTQRTPSPQQPFVNLRKRQTMILESNRAMQQPPPNHDQYSLERAFEEFQIQQSISLNNDDDIVMIHSSLNTTKQSDKPAMKINHYKRIK